MHCRYECRLATWCRQGPLHWSTDIHVLQRTASLLVQVANCPRLQPMAGCKKPKGEITLRCSARLAGQESVESAAAAGAAEADRVRHSPPFRSTTTCIHGTTSLH